MIRIAMKVKYADGSGVDVIASAPDLIAFERKFDKPMSAFAKDVRMEWMLFLTWTALSRQKKTSADFDTWIESVDEVAFGDDVDDIVPLETSQPTG